MTQDTPNHPLSLEPDDDDSELLEDPDDSLELRPEFIEELRAALDDDSPTSPAEEVARRLGLSW